MTDWLANPYVQGALTGFVSAAIVDFAAFRSWKSWQDGLAYSWSIATLRWVQGIVGGLLAAAGFEVIL